jgi:cytoskeletal protein RodZ
VVRLSTEPVPLGDNPRVRRRLILAGVWALGVAVALTLAFAAVGRVANGVAPRDVARLSSTEIEREVAGPSGPAVTSSSARAGTATTATTATSVTTTSSTSTTTSTTRPSGSTIVNPTTVATAATTTSTTAHTVPTTTATSPSAEPHNTVTTAQGGTVFSRCSGPEKIVYVAAVPKSGYQRTVDVENQGGIQQVFVNAHHRSQIEAECSGGVVHAQVEEESADD